MMLVWTILSIFKTEKKRKWNLILTLWILTPFHEHNSLIISSKCFYIMDSVISTPIHILHQKNDLCLKASTLTWANKLFRICCPTKKHSLILIRKNMCNLSLTIRASLTLSKMKRTIGQIYSPRRWFNSFNENMNN